jgi:hypothetical protein
VENGIFKIWDSNIYLYVNCSEYMEYNLTYELQKNLEVEETSLLAQCFHVIETKMNVEIEVIYNGNKWFDALDILSTVREPGKFLQINLRGNVLDKAYECLCDYTVRAGLRELD